jgi:hypothetical protein
VHHDIAHDEAAAETRLPSRRQVAAGLGALALGSFGLLVGPSPAFAALTPAVSAERHGHSHHGRHTHHGHHRRHHHTHHRRGHR